MSNMVNVVSSTLSAAKAAASGNSNLDTSGGRSGMPQGIIWSSKNKLSKLKDVSSNEVHKIQPETR